MRKALNFKVGPPTLAAALGLGLLTPLALGQIACGTAAKDQASSYQPEISTLLFADATPYPSASVKSGNAWVIAAGNTTYLQGTFAQSGGTAVLTPGNLNMVSATPIALTPTTSTTYTLTVTDAAGHVATKTATLTVLQAPVDTLTAPPAVVAGTGSYVASVPGTPTNDPTATYTWQATNATITGGTGTNSVTFTAGSAAADGSAKNMTVTCTVSVPTSNPIQVSQTATLPVDAVIPTAFSYANASPIYYEGLTIQPDLPIETGVVTQYSVNPALPAGLALDPVLGVISGTPTALAPAQNYTVSATNSGGTATTIVNLQVQAQPALVFNTPSPATIGPGGLSMLSWNAGANVASVQVTAVPNDASLPSTFPVSGSVNVTPSATTVYTLTGTLQGGGTEPPLTQTVTVNTTPLAFTTALSATPTLVSYGSGTGLSWTLAGTPNTFVLTSPAMAEPVPVSATASSLPINPVSRRQSYTLTATNGVTGSLDTVQSGPVTVAAAGLDTLAGNITLGGGNHDGTGTAAQFNNPFYPAMDPAGNLYVADTANHIIRVITPGGVVSTLAGIPGVPGKLDNVPGSQAQFNAPRGVAYWYDTTLGQACLFVAEYTNDTIRKITLDTTGPVPVATNVSLFAGTFGSYSGAGTFDDPNAIVIDSSNNMYVTESYYGDIRKITGLSGPEGNTYTQNGGTSTVYAGQSGSDGYLDGANTSALFNGVYGIALDPATGNLYVAEYYNNRIRKVTSTTTSTIAGLNTGASTSPAGFIDGPVGTSRLNGPGGVAISNGILYIADIKNNAVRTINLSDPTFTLTTVLGTPATNGAKPGTSGNTNAQGTLATLGGPQGLVFGATGDLYITEGVNDDVRVADTGLNVTTFAGSAPQVGSADGPQGIGELAISPALSTNATMAGLTMDSQQNLYVADTYNNAIRMITPAGTMTTIAGTAGLATAGHADGLGGAASFNQPSGLTIDPSGNLYVADYGNSTIRMLTKGANGWTVTTIAGLAGTTGVVEGAGATISGGAATSPGVATFDLPYGIVYNADGNLYVADTSNKAIRELTFSAATGVWTVSKLTTSGVTLSKPMALANDASGNLYLSDRGNYFVAQLINPGAGGGTWAGTIIGGVSGSYGYGNGPVGAAKGPGVSMFYYPEGLTVDGAGNVWLADYGENVIQEISPTTNAGVTTWTTSTPPFSQGVLTYNPPVLPVPLGTSVGPLATATVWQPQAVLVSPFAPHDLFVTTNGGVAQVTSIDGK